MHYILCIDIKVNFVLNLLNKIVHIQQVQPKEGVLRLRPYARILCIHDSVRTQKSCYFDEHNTQHSIPQHTNIHTNKLHADFSDMDTGTPRLGRH